jgi:hypothetical protein
MSWSQVNNVSIPWVKQIAEKLRRTHLPDLHGSTLWISSDYSFGNPACDFDSISFLVANPEKSYEWEVMRNEVRAGELGNRRMSWKKLSDRRRQKAFFQFLRAADSIHGVAIIFAMDRDPAFQMSTEEIMNQYRGRDWLLANWDAKSFENMIRISYFTALVVAALSCEGQQIIWISDQDAVFANETFHRDTATFFSKLLNLFSSHSYGEISVGTTAITESDLLEEDLASIPDLLCGGVGELLTSIKRKYGHVPRIAVDLPLLSNRAENFLRWLNTEPVLLQRRICLLERRLNGAIGGGILEFA